MTEEEVIAIIDANIKDNVSGEITPLKHRTVDYALLAYSKACCIAIKSFDVTLTPTEIGNLSTTSPAYILIAAPEANEYIVPEGNLSISKVSGSVAYNNSGVIRWGIASSVSTPTDYEFSMGGASINDLTVDSKVMICPIMQLWASFYEAGGVYLGCPILLRSIGTLAGGGDLTIRIRGKYRIYTV